MAVRILGSGDSPVWGAGHEVNSLPIENLPDDTIKVRRRIRNNQFAQCFVKTQRGIRHFYLGKSGEALKLMYEQGANITE